MAVPGRPPENESGDVERTSLTGSANEMLSKLNLEKIVFSVSKRGRITVSRYATSTIRRTSKACEAGMLDPFEEEGKAPQKSRAVSGGMRGPWPENSRSRGRNTACM